MIEDFLILNPQGRRKLIFDLKNKGITDHHVLEAISNIPREIFLEPDLYDKAYDDTALPIEHNQTISQPYTVAVMTQLLELKKNEKVLEIGTGSGYQSLILKFCEAELYTIERIPQLYRKAKALFESNGIDIHTELGDGSSGLPKFMPYDAIIITAGVPKIHNELVNQLKINGRIVAPVGDLTSQTMTKLIRHSQEEISISEHNKFRFVPLIGENAWNLDD